ncbi:hypothetical protein ACF1HJ_09835 [Streptomyces sp. NPDC013978]|uniref:hypothetical protein n=1 Tax=Streptomyces sp. NPDC013978 TaxID=3364869 RepID=UPI0037021E56
MSGSAGRSRRLRLEPGDIVRADRSGIVVLPAHGRDSKNAEGRRPALSRAAWVPFVSVLSTRR